MTQEAQPPEEKSAAPPLDLHAVINAVVKVPSQLEREWSRALNTQALETGILQLNQQLASLFNAIQLEATESGAAAESLGHSDTLDKWPLSLSDVVALSAGAEGEARYKQLNCALTYAIADLASAVNALQVPTGQEVKLPSGQVETWWESGAFNHLRLAAQLVSRINEQIYAMQVTPDSHTHDHASWNVQFGLGKNALEAALPEAAICYFNLAIKGLVAAVARRALPTMAKAIDLLRNIDRFIVVADLLEISSELAANHARGLLTDLSLSVPVAQALPTAFGLLLYPPLTNAERAQLAANTENEPTGGSDAGA